jgi:hypothetical protein
MEDMSRSFLFIGCVGLPAITLGSWEMIPSSKCDVKRSNDKTPPLQALLLCSQALSDSDRGCMNG